MKHRPVTVGVPVLLAVVLLAGAAVRRARGTLAVVTVKGTSMEPTYHRGDRVLVRRVGVGRLRAGQVIVVAAGLPVGAPPLHDPLLTIKRLVALPGDRVPRSESFRVSDATEDTVPDGCLVVAADNPDGADSRQLGYFAVDNLLGVVVRRLSPHPQRPAESAGAGVSPGR